MKRFFKRCSKAFFALLVLCGLMSANNQSNMYALAAHGKHSKRTTKVTKKKPKRKPKRNNRHSKTWQEREVKAKKWIAHVESRGEYNASNGKCFGKYQLLPSYLGYKNGHLNMNHQHQEKVADKYVHNRYGSWQRAKAFHQIHNWY